jgi:hypothetical protein
MENSDLNKAIERLEKEIQYLHVDYKRMLSRHEKLTAITDLRLKIKQAEESLRLKKRILHFTLG